MDMTTQAYHPKKCFLIAVIVCSTWATAHELKMPAVPPDQLALIQPPLAGSEIFARDLTGHWQGLVPEEQMEASQRIAENLGWLEKVGKGAVAGLGIRETAWLKWRVSEEITGLADGVYGLQVLDFRQKGFLESNLIDVDAQQGLMVLKVVLGDGPVEFVTHTTNFTTERNPAPYTIPVGETGTTYVLLRLEDVPAGGPSTQRLGFQPRGAQSQPRWWSFNFRTSLDGNLGIKIVDDSGASVPAMVRLTAKKSRRIWEPAGAADLRPMMNEVTSLPIYGPGRGYMMWVPEPWRGPYWVMPGPFEMALPAGEWEVHVWRGLENVPVKMDVTVKAGEWTRQNVTSKRWIDMGAKGWFAGDDHVHSRLMSGEDADKLMAWTRAADLAVCNVLEMGDDVRTWYAQRGFGPQYRVQNGNHWIVPGQEDPRGVLGHAIGLNLTSKVRDLNRYLDHRWVAGEIHRQGGLYGHTHVGAKALFVERQMALYNPFDLVDFNSVMQAALNTELMYHYLNLGYKMTASAGTDTPYGGTVGSVRVYAFAGNSGPFNPDAWFQAVKSGHTFVSTGPMIDFRVGESIPGDELEIRDDKLLKVRIVAHGLEGKSAPKFVRLIRFGKVLKEVVATVPAKGSLELECEVPPGNGGWLAAQVIGEDGSEALTTPVYLKRQGFRTWDVEQVPQLLEAQEVVLRDIETMVAESKKLAASRPMDYTLRSVGTGADTLLEHVAQARNHYRELSAIREKELISRKVR
jgi:hypothetical protein